VMNESEGMVDLLFIKPKECEYKESYDFSYWLCTNCRTSRVFEHCHPMHDEYNYCPKCGYKITTFSNYIEEDEI